MSGSDNLSRQFADLMRRSPKRALAIASVAVFFVVEAAMNMVGGYRRAGGDLQFAAFAYAIIMLAVAIMAAWSALEARHARGGRRAMLLALALPLFLISQANGWAVMGVTLADGGVKRETAADGRRSLADALKRARDQREAIGTPRPLATIESELDLELRRTSAQYPKGDGPRATKLKGEKGAAEKADALDKEIDRLTAELKRAPAVAGGSVDTEVLQGAADTVREWIAGRPLDKGEHTSAAAVQKWFSIALVALIGFCATFGWGLVLPGRSEAGADEEPFDMFDPALLPAPARPLALAAPAPAARSSSRAFETGARPGGAGQHSATAHSAPITINVGPSPGGPSATPASAGVALSAQASSSEPPARAPRHDVSSAPGDAPPSDRRPVQGVIDGLIAFRAAALADADGGLVPSSDVYRRYQAWRGDRACAEAAFHALFPEVTGVAAIDVAGVRHYGGVALRAREALRAVG